MNAGCAMEIMTVEMVATRLIYSVVVSRNILSIFQGLKGHLP